MVRMWRHVDVDKLERDYVAGEAAAVLRERNSLTVAQFDWLRTKYKFPSRERIIRENDAPDEDEERQSAASLALSPWVESRIKELREAKVLAEQQAEYEIAQVRMYRHHCSRV